MTKEPRTIAARGLTASNIGSTIEVRGQRYVVEDVKYQGDTTLVKITNYIALPNLIDIQIWDKSGAPAS